MTSTTVDASQRLVRMGPDRPHRMMGRHARHAAAGR
jgi:hypothetical protein